MARSFKELQDSGWRPDRTIIFAGWDGEEYGMLGSTEWGKHHQQLLREGAVAYINVDAGGGGTYFYATGVPALDQFLYDITANVTEPRNGLTVYEDWRTQAGGEPPAVERLGSGNLGPERSAALRWQQTATALEEEVAQVLTNRDATNSARNAVTHSTPHCADAPSPKHAHQPEGRRSSASMAQHSAQAFATLGTEYAGRDSIWDPWARVKSPTDRKMVRSRQQETSALHLCRARVRKHSATHRAASD